MIDNNEILKFENPIVETEYSLLIRYKDHLKKNKELMVFDLKEVIPIYSHYIKKNNNIEPWEAKYFINNHLTNITNAFKQFDERIIEYMLIDEAKKIMNIAKGSVLSSQYLTYCIDNAIINKDTIEVKLNSSIRFLTNPYYEWKENEYNNRKHIKSNIINTLLGNEKVNKNYNLIYEYICDHDCNKGAITKKSLSIETGLSLRTIKNYLNKYIPLNELFDKVKELSKTEKQRQISLYNSNKLVKRAS